MRMMTRIAIAGAAVCLVSASIARAAGDILFLTNAAVPSAADQAILTRLQLNYTVTQMDGHVAIPSNAGGKQLVITSASLSSSVIKNQWNSTGPVTTGGDGALYRNLGRPILNMQNGVTDELGFTVDANAGQGAGPNSGSSYPNPGNDINIVDPLSPLAAGLPAGFQPVFTTNGAGVSVFGNTNFSVLGNRMTPAAHIVAGITTLVFNNAAIDSAYVGIVSLQQGDTLGNTAADPDYSALAASRRVEFPIDSTSFLSLNTNGLALFDAAVAYAIAGPVVPEPSSVALAGIGLLGLIASRQIAGRRQR